MDGDPAKTHVREFTMTQNPLAGIKGPTSNGRGWLHGGKGEEIKGMARYGKGEKLRIHL